MNLVVNISKLIDLRKISIQIQNLVNIPFSVFEEKVQLNASIPLRHFKKSRLGFNG